MHNNRGPAKEKFIKKKLIHINLQFLHDHDLCEMDTR